MTKQSLYDILLPSTMKHQSPKKRGRIAFILLPVILYLFIFSPSIVPELYFKPVWAVNVEEADVSVGSDSSMAISKETETLIPFKRGKIFGYTSPEGDIKYRDVSLYGTLMSDGGFINYSNVSENLVVRKADGGIQSSIQTAGYPVYLERDRVVVLDTSRTSLKVLDITGVAKWKRDFPILITGIAGNGSLLFVGRADGFADLLDAEGELVYQWVTEGTRIPVVYACAVSKSGDYIAVIAGIDPQKMVLLQKKEDTYRPIATETLESSFRRSMNLQFSADEKYLFFEDLNVLKSYGIESRASFSLSAGTRSLDLEADLRTGLFYHLYAVPGHRVFQVFDSSGYIFTQILSSENSTINAQPGTLYLGEGNTFMRMDIRKN